ncbi:MAG: glycosyl hydrolase 43 family protein [Ruminococcaceae bacterium]|nr:glycosyl hydrolase 43 family protein [Oscillospiraceae bacterium]
MHCENPIIRSDYPDPDVIRVDDTYYMVTTTMHMFPGVQLLRSFDLINWEHLCYVADIIADTPAQRLDAGKGIYGKGMWAATLRYHQGVFHILFVCNDTGKTYHYTASEITGPWSCHELDEFYHDASLLFDDDGRVYVAYGNREIHITELLPDLSGPRPGGLDRIALVDEGDVRLGYEGSHLYKLNGKYWLFFIHWPNTGHGRRTQACFCADTIDGEFRGRDIFDEDLGFHNMGIAQGGIVDTPDGDWYMVLFQDSGAVGRIPTLVPFEWKDGFPCPAEFPKTVETRSTRPQHQYKPLYSSDTLRALPLSECWQWNHQPHNDLWSVTPDGLRITTDRTVDTVEQAVNTLTQRAFLPVSEMDVTVDGTALNVGDYAGICALQGCYTLLALTRREDGYALVKQSRKSAGRDREEQREELICALDKPVVRLRLRLKVQDMTDCARLYWLDNDVWREAGDGHKLVYRLDHFMGVRFALCCWSGKKAGGSALFNDCEYRIS